MKDDRGLPLADAHENTMFVDEAGLDYTIHPVNIGVGDS
jgi:hypothetical protein